MPDEKGEVPSLLRRTDEERTTLRNEIETPPDSCRKGRVWST